MDINERAARLDESIRSSLIEIDDEITKCNNHYELYKYLCEGISKLMTVDSFYIGYYTRSPVVAFPYTFNEGEIFAPGVIPYGEDGISNFVKSQRIPYTWNLDDGKLWEKGIKYGETARIKDCIVVPILPCEGGKSEVLGMLSVETYKQNYYEESHVTLLEYLASSVSHKLDVERRDFKRKSPLDPGNAISDPVLRVDNIVNSTIKKIQELEMIASSVIKDEFVSGNTDDNSLEKLKSIKEGCFKIQTEIIEIFVESVMYRNPLLRLSDIERKTLYLIYREYKASGKRIRNNDIATSLDRGEEMVKEYISNIRRKLNIANSDKQLTMTDVAQLVEFAESYFISSLVVE